METLLSHLTEHYIIVTLLGSFFSGSLFILVLSILASQIGLPIYEILLFSVLGNYLADLTYFFIARKIKSKKWILFFTKNPKLMNRINQLNKRFPKKRGGFIILVKFIYGIRILSIIVLGISKYPFYKFAFFDFMGVIIINFLICYSGYFYVKGTLTYLSALGYTWQIITVTFFGFILYLILRTLAKKLFYPNP